MLNRRDSNTERPMARPDLAHLPVHGSWLLQPATPHEVAPWRECSMTPPVWREGVLTSGAALR
jgi:hypothetical protein